MVELTKRWLCLAAGWSLLVLGAILIPLPGPGLLVILAGLTVLARHCEWARGLMARLKGFLKSRKEKACGDAPSSSSPALS